MSTATMSTVTLNTVSPATAAKRSHLHLTRRGRVVFTTLAAVPLIAGAFLMAINGGGALADGDGPGATFDYVTVQSGESLWQLAQEIAPTTDPRDVVDDIISLNQLHTANIQPGQKLAIPAKY